MIFDALTDSPKFTKAKCAEIEDKDFFFPDSALQWELRLERLEDLCGNCPHRVECRDYAIKEEIIEGFWGGTTPGQRKKIIKRNKTKEDRRSEAVREVQSLLEAGLTKEQIAKKLGIQVSSLERRILRAKKRGIL